MPRDVTDQTAPASAWLERFSPLITRSSRVLEIACGNGRNTRLLAQLSDHVTAVDIRPMPVVPPDIRFVLADLENGPWPFHEESFDVLVVVNYLWRPRFAELCSSLVDGGLLLYETFSHEQLTASFGPSRREHLLETGELLRLVPACWRIVAFEDGLTRHGAFYQRVAARKTRLNNLISPELVGLCTDR